MIMNAPLTSLERVGTNMGSNDIILAYSKSDYEEWGGKVSLSYPLSKMMMGLVFGGTGSAKSSVALWIVSSVMRSVPVDLTLLDFKKDEIWQFMDGYPRYFTNERCYDALKKFYNDYLEIRNSGKPSKVMKWLVFDEYPSYISYFKNHDNLHKTTIAKHSLSMISEIMNMGRSLNVSILIICQYPTSDLFNDARDNLQYKIGLGNLSVESKRMIFNNYEIPECNYKTAEGFMVVEGYPPVSVKYPLIQDISDFKYHLFRLLMEEHLKDCDIHDPLPNSDSK